MLWIRFASKKYEVFKQVMCGLLPSWCLKENTASSKGQFCGKNYYDTIGRKKEGMVDKKYLQFLCLK